jgi:galactose mutarotase-like enzyme
MGLHGIVRKRNFTLKEQTEDSISFSFKSTEETKLEYPFDFELVITYVLKDTTLRTQFTVINNSDKILPFSVGGHPGFNVPFVDGENFEDYYVQFDNGVEFDYLVFTENKLCSGNTAKLKTDNGIIKLKHNLFDNDAIFMLDNKNGVALKSNKNNRSVKVSYENMSHIGLWHTPFAEAPFLCIEPWHGSPAIDGKIDDFYDKNDMMTLDVNKTAILAFDITITE